MMAKTKHNILVFIVLVQSFGYVYYRIISQSYNEEEVAQKIKSDPLESKIIDTETERRLEKSENSKISSSNFSIDTSNDLYSYHHTKFFDDPELLKSQLSTAYTKENQFMKCLYSTAFGKIRIQFLA